MQNVKISTLECIATLGCVALIPSLLTGPTFTIQTFGTGSLSHIIYMIVLGISLFTILFGLFLKFNNMDIIDISEVAGGKFLKYFSGITTILYLMLTVILALSEFTENIRNIIFQNAPNEYFYFIFWVGMLISVFIGIRGIFRASTLLAPLILLGILFIFFSLYKDIDITNYFPLFGNDIYDFFIPGSFRLEMFESIFLILLMGPQLKNVKKSTIGSFLLIASSTLIIAILLFGIFPYPSSLQNYFPLFELNRLISFGRFIQRVESIYILIWLIAMYIYISLGTSYAVQTFSKIFNLKYSNRIIPAFCFLVFIGALFLESYITILNIRRFLYEYIIPIQLFLYPLLIMIIAIFKQKKEVK